LAPAARFFLFLSGCLGRRRRYRRRAPGFFFHTPSAESIGLFPRWLPPFVLIAAALFPRRGRRRRCNAGFRLLLLLLAGVFRRLFLLFLQIRKRRGIVQQFRQRLRRLQPSPRARRQGARQHRSAFLGKPLGPG
jgi:hypothetical protein